MYQLDLGGLFWHFDGLHVRWQAHDCQRSRTGLPHKRGTKLHPPTIFGVLESILV
jgi:hypothetical protein